MNELTPAEQEAYEFCIGFQDRVGLNTRDDLASEAAARNLIANKPAFGWTSSYGNAPAGTFAATVNMLGGIEAAQDDLRAHFARNGRDVTDECWLDNLLPLNRAAELDLMVAYQRVGTFRTADELKRRAGRYLGIPVVKGADFMGVAAE